MSGGPPKERGVTHLIQPPPGAPLRITRAHLPIANRLAFGALESGDLAVIVRDA